MHKYYTEIYKKNNAFLNKIILILALALAIPKMKKQKIIEQRIAKDQTQRLPEEIRKSIEQGKLNPVFPDGEAFGLWRGIHTEALENYLHEGISQVKASRCAETYFSLSREKAYIFDNHFLIWVKASLFNISKTMYGGENDLYTADKLFPQDIAFYFVKKSDWISLNLQTAIPVLSITSMSNLNIATIIKQHKASAEPLIVIFDSTYEELFTLSFMQSLFTDILPNDLLAISIAHYLNHQAF